MFNSMFAELKEVKYLTKITYFKKSYDVKYFKKIKRLIRIQKVEPYLEPKQASMMELFCEYT